MNKLHVHSLRKHEILRKKQQISFLFRSGKSVKGSFLKIVYASLKPEKELFQGFPAILFAVSKKTVPSSVQRNRVKRMMREAYRLEKSSPESGVEIMQDASAGVLRGMAFLYIGKKNIFPDLAIFREEIRGLMKSMRRS